jgi:hypothetical protein
MSRTVCGICWCPFDEYTGECACHPNDDIIALAQKCGDWNGQTAEFNDVGLARFVTLTTERDTALLQQALEALEHHVEQTRPIHRTSETITALRERLGETDKT